ncbi:MAG: hypothetical protein ABIZ05_07040 [Pseudonocardiaceae bacterium]
MLQVHTCVSVHCDQCGDALGDPGFEAHYPTERSALTAATASRWRTDRGRRLLCSACTPVLTCEAEGHQFSRWRHPVTAEGHPAGSEYRHCWRCCRHESRPATRTVVDGAEGVDVAGEVW